MDTQKEKKQKRTRSPGYPLIGLEKAIGYVKMLWDKDAANPIPKEAAYVHLGYDKGGGYAGRVVAALKHFDLISVKDSDIILTQDAIDLSLYDATSDEYKNIARNIALKPSIYRKIYDEYSGCLPSDETLRIKLIREYGFNRDKVNNFINNFRNTIAFAELTEPIEEKGEKEEITPNIETTLMQTSSSISHKKENLPSPSQGVQTYPIPLSKGNKAAIMFETTPIDEEDIALIEGWLKLFAKTLTEKPT